MAHVNHGQTIQGMVWHTKYILVTIYVRLAVIYIRLNHTLCNVNFGCGLAATRQYASWLLLKWISFVQSPYCVTSYLSLLTSVFRGEFWSVRFIETWNFCQVLFNNSKSTDLRETQNRNAESAIGLCTIPFIFIANVYILIRY